jgi:hypothetical protein
MKANRGEITFGDKAQRSYKDSVALTEYLQKHASDPKPWYSYDPKRDTANLMHFIVLKGEKIQDMTDGNSGEYIIEHIYHTMPKVFFFMIPLMAFFLGILFFKRKIFFANHAIFSLHFHSLVFSVLILQYIPYIKKVPFLTVVLLGIAFIYLIAALKNAYDIRWLRSFAYAISLSAGYGLFLLIAMFVDFLAIFYFV